MMVELLLAHGADPTATDVHNATADVVAKQNGFINLGSRLRLAMFGASEQLGDYIDKQASEGQRGSAKFRPQRSTKLAVRGICHFTGILRVPRLHRLAHWSGSGLNA